MYVTICCCRRSDFTSSSAAFSRLQVWVTNCWKPEFVFARHGRHSRRGISSVLQFDIEPFSDDFRSPDLVFGLVSTSWVMYIICWRMYAKWQPACIPLSPAVKGSLLAPSILPLNAAFDIVVKLFAPGIPSFCDFRLVPSSVGCTSTDLSSYSPMLQGGMEAGDLRIPVPPGVVTTTQHVLCFRFGGDATIATYHQLLPLTPLEAGVFTLSSFPPNSPVEPIHFCAHDCQDCVSSSCQSLPSPSWGDFAAC